ncbi:MAG: hypothetical protein L0Z50_20425, partial [Verrucomicrobiales bacterium]|nr:hypothetical protein [Verrucomicrobiales bacterium]
GEPNVSSRAPRTRSEILQPKQHSAFVTWFFKTWSLRRLSVIVLLCLCCDKATGAGLVTVWNDLTLRAIRYGNVPPPVAVRQMAMVHLAICEAANGVEGRYKPFQVEAGPKECSLEASVSAAAYHSLRTMFPKSAESFDSHYRAILSVIPNTSAKTNGIEWGKRVAKEFLKLRQFDGAGQSTSYNDDTRPGYWQRTLPNFDNPLMPNWGHVKPFAIRSVEELRPPPPPLLNSTEWAAQYNLVKVMGFRARGMLGQAKLAYPSREPRFSGPSAKLVMRELPSRDFHSAAFILVGPRVAVDREFVPKKNGSD